MTIVSEWLNYITNFRNCLSHKASCMMFSQESGTSLMAFYDTGTVAFSRAVDSTIPVAILAHGLGRLTPHPSSLDMDLMSLPWSSTEGTTSPNTKSQIGIRPGTGSLFTTNSNLDIPSGPWSALHLCPRALVEQNSKEQCMRLGWNQRDDHPSIFPFAHAFCI